MLEHCVHSTAVELTVHLTVLVLGTLSATTLPSTLILLENLEKKPENPASSERNWLTFEMCDISC